MAPEYSGPSGEMFNKDLHADMWLVTTAEQQKSSSVAVVRIESLARAESIKKRGMHAEVNGDIAI